MFKTKERFLSKWKMRKIFTAKKPRMLQKFLAVGVSFSLAAAMVPKTGAFAAGEAPTIFYEAATANHWGRSDLRAYLNGVEKSRQHATD